MRLQKLCQNNIWGDFYNAEVSGENLIVDKTTGYFNATRFCSMKGKKIKEWLKTQRTIDIKKMFIKQGLRNSLKFYEVKYSKDDMGSKYDKNALKDINGLYLFEGFLLDMFCWLIPSFYLESSELIVLELTENKKESAIL